MFYLFDPETKMESSDGKKVRVAATDKTTQGVMFIGFMDRKGMLLFHAVPQGQTGNAVYYSKVGCLYFIKINSSKHIIHLTYFYSFNNSYIFIKKNVLFQVLNRNLAKAGKDPMIYLTI